MQFDDLPIQNQVRERLYGLYEADKIPHAILFSGKEGSGNLAAAIAFAQLVLCDNPTNNDSCGECPNCKKVNQYLHPDMHFSFPFIKSKDKDLSTVFMEEWRKLLSHSLFPTLRDWQMYLDAENKKFNIYASEIRDIAKRLSLKSYSGKKKVLIMWLPELMGKEGNMLLKLIEEPPADTLFFLVTEDESSILTTIISRTQRFYIPRPEFSHLVDFLLNSNIELSKEKAESAALVSKGNVNVAQLVVNDIEEPFFDTFRNWLLACHSEKHLEIQTKVEDLSKSGRENIINFLNYGLELIRVVLSHSKGFQNNAMPEKEKEFVVKFANLMEGRSFDDLYQLFNDSIFGVERNGNTKLILTTLSIGIKDIFANKRKIKGYYGMY